MLFTSCTPQGVNNTPFKQAEKTSATLYSKTEGITPTPETQTTVKPSASTVPTYTEIRHKVDSYFRVFVIYS